MLESIKIKNVALIRDVSIDFVNGFNVLMGETGAGKSIVLDAINFALGQKVDKDLITSGENQMRVEAVFCDLSLDLQNEMSNFGLMNEEKLIISRMYDIAGKSDIKVNGSSVTLSMLRSITKFLVESYSQNENLVLLKTKEQLALLDNFSQMYFAGEKQKIKTLVKSLNEIQTKLDEIGTNFENRERMIDLLKFQIDEIEKINPSQEKEDEIIDIISKYNNAEKITSNLQGAISELDEGEFSCLNQLRLAVRQLGSISNFSKEYSNLENQLNNAMIDIEDAVSSLQKQAREIYFDENEYQKLDLKLDEYKMLKKKYGGTIQKVLEFLNKAKNDYDNLIFAEDKMAKLESEKLKLINQANEVCEILSEKRKEKAKELESQIKLELGMLGMKNANFVVNFTKKEKFDENGFDEIEFLFSANTGIEVRPLSKIISGGEMSRFSLALKNIIKQNNACLIFDEIDSGISGEIGREVGKRIAKLSLDNQVICISHSPQVCAMADCFNLVVKQVENSVTFSNVVKLTDEEIVRELAKMSSGKDLTQISLSHANELLKRAKDLKCSF